MEKQNQWNEWHDDVENPVYQVNRIKDFINSIKIMLELTGDTYRDSDDIRIAYYMSY